MEGGHTSGGITQISSLAGLDLGAELVAAGCRSSSEASARPTPPAALPDTSWIFGVQGGTPAAAEPMLAFGSAGILSGNDSCENWGGAFTTSSSTLAISGLKTTSLVECARETAAIATASRTSLGAVTSWQATAADDVTLPSGVLVRSPVKLVLSGAEDLIFSQD